MLPSKTRWMVGNPDPALVKKLCRRLGVRPLLAALLASRGHTAEEAAFFLSDDLFFHDPFLLKDMGLAVDRIREAIRRKEKLLIYGDYDADGVSSTSLLIRLFKQLDADFTYRIPHRIEDGYGLHTSYLERAKQEGISLVITVDTGITGVEQAEAAESLGLDLIITDHHEPPEKLPGALAVINPKQQACGYPFEGLSGAGVAFKLAQALLGRVPEELADFAALGTVADLMPLTGENRSIVKLGLKRMRELPSVGLRALLTLAGTKAEDVTAGTVGFALAPRINAAGRLDSADDAVRLLIAEDEGDAEAIAKRLDELNKERQRMVEAVAVEAKRMVEERGGPGDAIVVASDRWNPGIIGIVASRLVETFYRPAVVIAFDAVTGIGKGSARAIQGFHLYEALKCCEPLLDRFGGHETAAGLSISKENFDRFVAAFESEARARLTSELKIPVTNVDAELALSEITLDAIEELEKLAPFGMANPAPFFAVKDAVVKDAATMGQRRNHAKFVLADGVGELEAVAFGFGKAAAQIAAGSELSVVGELSINEWKGKRKPQIIVKDVSVPHIQLFDWRGIKSASAWMERWSRMAGDGWRPALLLGSRGGTPAAFSLWRDGNRLPFFQLVGEDEGSRLVVPANPTAERLLLSEITDLFLVHCPFPYEQFHRILRRASSLCRMYALDVDDGGGGNSVVRERAAVTVDRNVIKRVYVEMRALTEASEEAWVRLLEERTEFNGETIRLAITVLRELELVEGGEASGGMLRLATVTVKRDLADSPTFAREQRWAFARQEWKRSPADVLRYRLLGQDRRGSLHEKNQATEAIG